jgi:hypothetical protein
MPFVITFFVTLINCDLNMYSHIPYKPLQNYDYMQKNLIKEPFYVRIKVPIVQKIYMGYFKLYYALLDLKKVLIFACFNVMICIKFEPLNY